MAKAFQASALAAAAATACALQPEGAAGSGAGLPISGTTIFLLVLAAFVIWIVARKTGRRPEAQPPPRPARAVARAPRAAPRGINVTPERFAMSVAAISGLCVLLVFLLALCNVSDALESRRAPAGPEERLASAAPPTVAPAAAIDPGSDCSSPVDIGDFTATVSRAERLHGGSVASLTVELTTSAPATDVYLDRFDLVSSRGVVGDRIAAGSGGDRLTLRRGERVDAEMVFATDPADSSFNLRYAWLVTRDDAQRFVAPFAMNCGSAGA